MSRVRKSTSILRGIQRFSLDYGFTRVTSSPMYAHGNGAAEKAVQTVKQMLTKENDLHLTLLSYRYSPQLGLYSPTELLMGRNLRTTVMKHPDNLKPKPPYHDNFITKNDLYKERMKQNHDANR